MLFSFQSLYEIQLIELIISHVSQMKYKENISYVNIYDGPFILMLSLKFKIYEMRNI